MKKENAHSESAGFNSSKDQKTMPTAEKMISNGPVRDGYLNAVITLNDC